MSEQTTMKVTRTKQTAADRLAKLDQQIAAGESWLDTLRARRRDLVAQEQAKPDAIAAFVAGAKGSGS